MDRLAIFGGSFNPIHNGHIHLALTMHERFRFTKILLIPAGEPPHKSSEELVSGEHRMEMLCLVAKEHPVFEPNDMELLRKGKSFTVDTVRELKRQNPDAELFLLMGGDMLQCFTAWREYKEILRLCTLLTAARTQDSARNTALRECAEALEVEGGHCIFCELDVLEVSSTQLRRALHAGKDIDRYVPPGVAAYIEQNHLYQVAQNERKGAQTNR